MGEVLCGVLTGMAFGRSIPPMFTSPMDQPRHLGQFYMVLRADVCQSQSDFESWLQQMTDEVRREPSKTGKRVQLANDPQIEEEQRRQKKGKPVNDSLLNEFHKLSSELNVEMVLWKTVTIKKGKKHSYQRNIFQCSLCYGKVMRWRILVWWIFCIYCWQTYE